MGNEHENSIPVIRSLQSHRSSLTSQVNPSSFASSLQYFDAATLHRSRLKPSKLHKDALENNGNAGNENLNSLFQRSSSDDDSIGSETDYNGILASLGLDESSESTLPTDFSLRCLMDLPTFHFELDSKTKASYVSNFEAQTAPLPINKEVELDCFNSNENLNDSWKPARERLGWTLETPEFIPPEFMSSAALSHQAHLLQLPLLLLEGELQPKNYVTYPTNPVQKAHREAIFYISAKNFTAGFNISFFAIRVDCPFGQYITVRVHTNRNKGPTRLVCKFWPVVIGEHEVSVMLRNGFQHVDGSPFPILICKDPTFNKPSGLAPLRNIPTFPLRLNNCYASDFAKFWGITYNPGTNELYAADRSGSEILVFSLANKELMKSGSWKLPEIPELKKQFHPTGIALDSNAQRVFVTDKGNHIVVIFTTTGEFISYFGSQGYYNGQFLYPWGVAVSPKGDFVVVADSKNHRIQLFTSDGRFLRKYSVFETNPYGFRREFDQPRGICFSADGTHIIVTDFNIANSFSFDIELKFLGTFGPPGILFRPQVVSLDPKTKNVIIADSRRNLVHCLSPDGTLVKTIDRNGDEHLEMTLGACAVDGALCIVDRGGRRLRLLQKYN